MSIKGVLLDLYGVLYIGDDLLPHALSSIEQLKKSGIPYQFITNTTRTTRDNLLQSLSSKGLVIPKEQIFTAPIATSKYLKENSLNPYLLIHPNLLVEFLEFKNSNYNAVVVGDAGTDFNYNNLNLAFRILFEGAPLIAMGMNQYFKESGGFSLDAGPFVKALEYASGKKATILGKPSKEFFLKAIEEFDCVPDQVVMVGDDVYADINGATDAGLQAILVKTGKYTPQDDQQIKSDNVQVVDNIKDAVHTICETN